MSFTNRIAGLMSTKPQVVVFGNVKENLAIGLALKAAGMKALLPDPWSHHGEDVLSIGDVGRAMKMINELRPPPAAVVINMPGLKTEELAFDKEPVMLLAERLKEGNIPVLVIDGVPYDDGFTGDEKQMMDDVGIRYAHGGDAPPHLIPSLVRDMISDKGVGGPGLGLAG